MEKQIPSNISKRIFWRFINLKIERIINAYHVFAIINILFDELVKDLKSGKEIKIHNFGSLLLKTTNPRRYFDVFQQKVCLGKSNRILQLFLTKKLRNKIINHFNHEPKSE